MQISVTYNPRDLERSLSQFVADVAATVQTEARKNTPIKSGRARRGWVKSTSADNFEVKNQVPYIGKLEAGASRQAPRGIIGPTLTTVKGKYS
jgi:hypothetical protein